MGKGIGRKERSEWRKAESGEGGRVHGVWVLLNFFSALTFSIRTCCVC